MQTIFTYAVFVIVIGSYSAVKIQEHQKINLSCAVFGFLISMGVNFMLREMFGYFSIDEDFFREYPYLFCLYAIVHTIFCYFIMYFLHKILHQYYYEQRIGELKAVYVRKILFLLLLEVGICGMILLFQTIYGNYAGFSAGTIKYNVLIFLFLAVSIGIVTVIFLKNTFTQQQFKEEMEQVKAMKDYVDRIEALYLDIRSFKHDYINILSSLHTYVNERNYEGLEKYFEQEILPAGSRIAMEDSVYGRLGYLKEPEIKSIVYTKVFYAMKKGIHVRTELKDTIDDFPMKVIDLVRILGILLDNAIEASELTSEKMLCISFLKDTEGIYIQITNSTFEIENIEKLYQIDISSKGEGHGIGLYEVRKIAEQYTNVLLNTEYHDFVFSQELTLLYE